MDTKKQLQNRILQHATYMNKRWVELVDEANKRNDIWYKQGEKQAFYDAQTSLKQYSLIADFSTEGIVEMNDE